jgi:ParB/RepB/Spo0J family partition protein
VGNHELFYEKSRAWIITPERGEEKDNMTIVSTLKPEVHDQSNVQRCTLVPIGKILACPDQPRTELGDLSGLAASITEHGQLQPLVVRDNGDDTYTLIAGQRRLAAARLARMKTVPVTVSHGDPAVLALVENLQRQELAPLEEAEAIRRLLDRDGETQQSVASQLGVSRDYIAQRVRLLHLPGEAQRLLEWESITPAAAREVLRLAVFDKVATEPPPRDRESWADQWAKYVLWRPCYARTVADVRYCVDEQLSGLVWMWAWSYGKEPAAALAEAEVIDEKCHERAEQLCKEERWHEALQTSNEEWAADRLLWLRPDWDRLSRADMLELFAAHDRWCEGPAAAA